MESFLNFWRNLGRPARAGFAGGVAVIVLAVAAFGIWALRVDYGVLFSDLTQADLSAMAGELGKMKVPYKVGPDGNSLLVPETIVHKTRVAVMGKDLPLRGAVGFELFNNMEFGVSEFVQKVNFQRALQGELTRTILAIDEVQSARVHLALTEQGLFRKEANKSKASVTIATKPGRTLQPVQVQGIQRLVAASVADVQAQDVTVLDQHGVALSRAMQIDASAVDVGGATQLDMKRSVEGYLTQKAAKVLDQMFGAGGSVVSVDAVLASELTRVTTEEVLGARGGDPSQPTSGVVLRERQTTKDTGNDASHAGTATVTNSETDYQTGKRTEQVVSPAGGLKLLNVAVVVKRSLNDTEVQRVRELVAASVGFSASRGDLVTVHSMDQLQSDPGNRPAPVGSESPVPQTPVAATPDRLGDKAWPVPSTALAVMAALGVLVLAALGALAVVLRQRRAPRAVVPQLSLGDAERARLLQSVQQWLTHRPAGAGAEVGQGKR
jgi:flagellar M-ring protein FliF